MRAELVRAPIITRWRGGPNPPQTGLLQGPLVEKAAGPERARCWWKDGQAQEAQQVQEQPEPQVKHLGEAQGGCQTWGTVYRAMYAAK